MPDTITDKYVKLPQLNYYDGKIKAWVGTQISNIGTVFTLKGRVDAVSDLPTTDVKAGDVYLVGAADAVEFDEYVRTSDNKWEMFGKTAETVDLTGYITESTLYKGTDDTGTTTAPAAGTILATLISSLPVATNADVDALFTA